MEKKRIIIIERREEEEDETAVMVRAVFLCVCVVDAYVEMVFLLLFVLRRLQ